MNKTIIHCNSNSSLVGDQFYFLEWTSTYLSLSVCLSLSLYLISKQLSIFLQMKNLIWWNFVLDFDFSISSSGKNDIVKERDKEGRFEERLLVVSVCVVFDRGSNVGIHLVNFLQLNKAIRRLGTPAAHPWEDCSLFRKPIQREMDCLCRYWLNYHVYRRLIEP